MKGRLFEIARDLDLDLITEEEAKNLLLKMLSDEYEYLVKVEYAYIEDTCGVRDDRVEEIWIDKKYFDSIKED